MNFIGVLGEILVYSLLLGLFFWGMKSAVSFYVFARRKEEINKLNARISILKMHLKGKIKRKTNKIEKVLKKSPEVLTQLGPKLNTICTLEFSTPADYQTLISSLTMITQDIIDHIKLKHKTPGRLQEATGPETNTVTLSDADLVNEIYKKLIKYDKAHMLIIIEIIQSTDQLRAKISEFNELADYEKSRKKILIMTEKIEIENYELLSEMVEKAKHSDIDASDYPVLEQELYKENA